ncbi:heterokaryon incompatibility protein-domain-containing protein [Tricladium varicosporioides]|nr:heterokaryon incompatibility protein-domain-containing protein [Hymenoscyphus varicosporioides]
MRLLNSRTLEVEEFFADRVPGYAILSHRWLDGEVSLQEMQTGAAKKKAGYAKIQLCCDQAVQDGLEYAWVDTCCIDKTSSAELTEAINSMYQWYQNAAVCYAYLSDVQVTGELEHSGFTDSAWFTRGWTLQELIAPTKVLFYDAIWQGFGTKESLKDSISAITGIDLDMLKGGDPRRFSIAKRMSWAANRITTRVEDIGYSLLGIFGVNMPMLYGEGEGAFIRLQEEIMKHSDDHSLFAWESVEKGYRGLLSKSPADFRDCRNIVTASFRLTLTPYSVTNRGLSITLPMKGWAMDTYIAGLDCEVENVPESRVGILLRLLPDSGQYARVEVEGKDTPIFTKEFIQQSTYRQIYVKREFLDSPLTVDWKYGFWLRSFPNTKKPISGWGNEHCICKVTSWNEWNDEERILEIPTGSHGTAGVIWYGSNTGYSFLKIGFDAMFNPMCLMAGPCWGPTARFYGPNDQDSFGDEMDPGWMESRKGDEWLLKGDRRTGINYYDYPRRVSITQEVIDNQRIWVVDIELLRSHQRGHHHQGVVCDGCNHDIYGVRFKCCVCSDFDYCSQCIQSSNDTHPSHNFREIEE